MYEIAPSEFKKGRKYLAGAVGAPVILTGIPLLITGLLTLLVASGPPAAVAMVFFGLISAAVGLLIGLVISGVLIHRRSKWSREIRERIAADGIRAEEVDWFRHELRSNEKRTLKALTARDLLLADAYRETLASRLTATRIVRSAKRELSNARRRESSVKRLSKGGATDHQAEIQDDIRKISRIEEQAREMLAEAETRLQMIEATAVRHGGIADHELALKKLSARAAELPLALESARMHEKIMEELEDRGSEDLTLPAGPGETIEEANGPSSRSDA